jgi:hypothetical protein
VRNKKILFIGFISCEIPVIFPLSALSDRENKGDVSNQKIKNAYYSKQKVFKTAYSGKQNW